MRDCQAVSAQNSSEILAIRHSATKPPVSFRAVSYTSLPDLSAQGIR